MQLPLQDFATLVKTQSAAVAQSSTQLIDMTVGSVLRAILEANASVGIWIQWLIMQVLALTRASTSSGTDLDSWVSDFGMERLAASPAGGQVTFSRAVAGMGTSISVGALVRTGTGPSDQTFAVASDTSHVDWSGTGYTLTADLLSISVPVLAQTPGAAGNVRAGTVTLLATALPGIDSVVNAASMSGGLDAESDTALRARFSGFLDSRTRATEQAVKYAIASVQQGLSFTVAERVDASGAIRPGHFTVTVDDGTGAPSAALVASVAAAIDAIRPIGGTFSVRAPLIIPVFVVANVVGTAQAIANAQAAVSAFISGLTIGSPLVISRLFQVIHDADSGIQSIAAVALNAANTDIVPPIYGLIRPSGVVISS